MEVEVKVDLIERIKTHIKEHKEAYITGGIVGATALIIGIFVGKKFVSSEIVEELAEVVAPAVFNNHNIVDNSTTIVGRSKMSKIVSLDGTDKWFISQAEAARHLGVSPVAITKHLNDGDTLPGGISLTRRGIAA